MTLILNGTDNSATTPAVTGTDPDTGVYYPAANQVALATNGTQAMLANASQGVQFANAIGVGATTPTTSGAGVTFPATQSASSNANTLDDYEEGSWTPTIATSGTQPTVSYSDRAGKYTKVGNVVTAVCSLRANISNVGSGYPIVQGLPFAESLFGPGPAMSIANILTDNDVKAAYMTGTEVRFDQSAYGVNNNGYLNFSISYIAS